MKFLSFSIAFIFISNIALFQCVNFTPEFPVNATNFKIVEIPLKNQIGVYFSIALSNQQIRVYNISSHSLQNTLLLSSYPNMTFFSKVPYTDYVSFIDIPQQNQQLVVLDAQTGLKQYIVEFNQTINIEKQVNINSTSFAIAYFNEAMYFQIYYFAYDRYVAQKVDINISSLYSMVANETTIIYIGKDYYSKTIDLKAYNYDRQQIQTLYSSESLTKFFYLTGMTLFNLQNNLIGLNLINSTVLIFNLSESQIQPTTIIFNFTSFGYCISAQAFQNPTIACFGIQNKQNTIVLYDLVQKSVVNSVTETEIIYQISMETNTTIDYVTPSYLKEWKFQ